MTSSKFDKKALCLKNAIILRNTRCFSMPNVEIECSQILLQFPNNPENLQNLQCRISWNLTALIDAIKHYTGEKGGLDSKETITQAPPLHLSSGSQKKLEAIDALMIASFEPLDLSSSWVKFWGVSQPPGTLVVNNLTPFQSLRLQGVVIVENMLGNSSAKVTTKFNEIIIDGVGFSVVMESYVIPNSEP